MSLFWQKSVILVQLGMGWHAEPYPSINPLTSEEQRAISHKEIETSELRLPTSVCFSLKTNYSAIPVHKEHYFLCFLFVKGGLKWMRNFVIYKGEQFSVNAGNLSH